MDCKLRRENAAIREKLCEINEEKAVDLDFTLPDYCADVEKILKCSLRPKITVRTAVSDRLELEGICEISVCYLDQAGEQVRYCEKTVPFSLGAPLLRAVTAPVIDASAYTQYVSCRAVSSRRIDIHGAFRVTAKVCDPGRYSFVTEIDEHGVEQKVSHFPVSENVAMAAHPFLVGGQLSIGAGKLPVDTILRHEAKVFLEDTKLLSGSAVLKGNVTLQVFTQSAGEKAQPELHVFELPFSETVDCPGADGDCSGYASVQICEDALSVEPDSSGENTVFSFEARLIASAFAYRKGEICAVTDAYCRECETKLEYSTVMLQMLEQTVSASQPLRFSLSDLTEQPSQVLDLWSEGESVHFEVQGAVLSGKGKCNLCLLYKTKEGRIGYLERPQEFSFDHALLCEVPGAICEGSAQLRPLTLSLNSGSGAQIETLVSFRAAIYAQREAKTVSAVFADESKPYREAGEQALCLYWANPGEELWNIAKAHRADLMQLHSENPAIPEVLTQSTMLLIPV